MNHCMAANELGEIFLGAAVEEWSERQMVERVHGRLTDAGAPFLLLANFQLGGRQIDCVIVTKRRVAVVEVKTSHLPVCGEIDGDGQGFTYRVSGDSTPTAISRRWGRKTAC